MNSEDQQTIPNTASSDVVESLAEETMDEEEENTDRTVEVRTRRARTPKQDPRRPRSAYAAGIYVPRTQNSRSPASANRKPQEFLTGIEHKTKFMRDAVQDDSCKSRFNSGAMSYQGQQTRKETRSVNKWRQNILNNCLERQPQRKRDAKEFAKMGSYLSRTFPNRNQPQLNKSAEVRIKHALDHSMATNSKISENSKSPIDVSKCTGVVKEGSDATKAGKISKLQKINRRVSPSNETVKLEASATQGEEMTVDCSSPTLDEASNMPEPNISDNLKEGTHKGGGLWLNLPKSPKSEQRSSNNSRRTTPRSPLCPPPGQKIFSNSRLHLPIAKTPSPRTGNSVTSSETLETQNTSSPQATVSSSLPVRGPINKCKFLPRSDSKTRDLFAKSPQSKMAIGKQEPITFTTHFVPLLRWTNKTSSGDLFEPHGHQGLHNRPNSTNSNANPDGGNVFNGKHPEGELSNQQSKETAGNNVVQNACFIKQHHGADEDNDILHPSLLYTSGEGENLANVRRTKKKSPTQDGAPSTDADLSETRNYANPVKPAWKLTGPQQIVSGCMLSSSTTSAQIRRPQSVKNIAMAREPAAYLRSANRAIFAAIKEKTNEAAGNRKPVWK